MLDTLTSAPARIALGAIPAVPAVETVNNAGHGILQQITTYAGALLASTVVHLGLKLIDYLKKKYSKTNGNKPIITETEQIKS